MCFVFFRFIVFLCVFFCYIVFFIFYKILYAIANNLPYLDSAVAAVTETETGAGAGLRSPYPVTGFQTIPWEVRLRGSVDLLALNVVTDLIVFLHSLHEYPSGGPPLTCLSAWSSRWVKQSAQ